MDRPKEHIAQPQQILSVCYGYGGLETGVAQVIPIKPVAYVEIEAFQVFNLVAAMEAGLVAPAPVWTDIKTFDAKPFHNKIHGIVGGYPCQGESNAGKRQLWDDPRFLWPYIERAMRTAKPLWGFFENVEGHLSGSFPYILKSLRDMGYGVEAGLFSAAEVGAPHRRKRLFILAVHTHAIELLSGACLAHTADRNGRDKQKRGENTVSTAKGSTDAVAYPNHDHRGLSEPKRREKDRQTPGSGKTLADPNGKGWDSIGLSGGAETELSRPALIGKAMADPDRLGSGKSYRRTTPAKPGEDGEKWPARPGQPQHDWEAPRTIPKKVRRPGKSGSKSGLGSTVNGYNFRVELLRQYGNGVVPQQAALAFSTLLKTHINNIKK